MEKQSRQKLESSLNGIQFEEKNDQKRTKKNESKGNKCGIKKPKTEKEKSIQPTISSK
jgi:hypothetical protein